MKQFAKIAWKYIFPFKKYAFLNILFNLLGSFFSVFSLVLVSPFLGVLFKTQEAAEKLVPWALDKDAIVNNCNYYLSYHMTTYGPANTLMLLSGFLILMFLLKTGSMFLANYFIVYLRTGVEKNMRTAMYNKILALPISYFSDSRKGDIIARMSNDIGEIQWSILNSLVMTFRDPITIIITLTSLLLISPSLTLFVLVLLPISGFIIGRLGKNLKKTGLEIQNKFGEILSLLEETLSGLRIIKAFNAEKKVKARFEKENKSFTHIMTRNMRRRELASPLSEFLGVLVIVIIMWYGGGLVLSGESSLAPQSFIMYLAVFYNIINPAKSFSSSMYNIQKGIASIERINKILDAEETIVEKENAEPIKKFTESVEFKNVSFKYENEYVLKNINLKIEKGKTVALVGQSGSGKSTMVDLIPRFYDVEEGGIYIDGHEVKDLKIADLRHLMGNVNQESILFNGTFFENIAFGVDNAKLEDVIAAAKVANAHEFIEASEEGYNTNIGDRGNKLSGGQRQRISIARAVLKNPPILILDEATSALDTESERLVQDALTNLMKNRTSIVIAHRLSTVKHADEICVLQSGEIIERGTHDQLLEKSGTYKKLHDMQMF
jgi:ATP-binding cassette, subfamily B, bacterial MsbA